jgi:hypothetical protein
MYRRNARTGIIWGCKVSYNKMVVDSRQRDENTTIHVINYFESEALSSLFIFRFCNLSFPAHYILTSHTVTKRKGSRFGQHFRPYHLQDCVHFSQSVSMIAALHQFQANLCVFSRKDARILGLDCPMHCKKTWLVYYDTVLDKTWYRHMLCTNHKLVR